MPSTCTLTSVPLLFLAAIDCYCNWLLLITIKTIVTTKDIHKMMYGLVFVEESWAVN